MLTASFPKNMVAMVGIQRSKNTIPCPKNIKFVKSMKMEPLAQGDLYYQAYPSCSWGHELGAGNVKTLVIPSWPT